jgi:2,3-bisphosphoglycerate-dependent phosphoglycerate mutase
MQLDRLTGEQVIALELATGAPLVYEMAQDGTTVKSKRILG